MEMTRRFSESPEDDIQLLFIKQLAQACCPGLDAGGGAVGWTLRYEALKKYEDQTSVWLSVRHIRLENVSNRAEPLSSVPAAIHVVGVAVGRVY